MRSRASIRTTFLATSFAALASVGAVGATGGEIPSDEASPVRSDTEALRADAEAYASRFGVTVSEAETRILATGPIAEILANLEASRPDSFAGGYIRHEPTFGVVLHFTSTDVPEIPEIAALSALEVSVETQSDAAHTLAELHAGLQAMAEIVDAKYPSSGMYVAVESGDVRLTGPHDFSDEEIGELTAVAGVPVSADVMPEFHDVLGYGGRLIDIDGVGGCTTGFSVFDAIYGTTGILTAGHCIGQVNAVNATYHDIDGTFDPVVRRGVRWDANQDFSWWDTPGADIPRFWDGSQYRDVTGTALRINTSGAWVCHWGRWTWFSCGVVDTIRYRPPVEACREMCSDRWAAVINDPTWKCWDGDSGGPVFSVGVAYGIFKGGNTHGDFAGACTLGAFMTAEQLTWDGVNTRIMIAP